MWKARNGEQLFYMTATISEADFVRLAELRMGVKPEKVWRV